MSYEKDGAEIYRQSFATIRAEAALDRFPGGLERVVVRMIHACGMVDLAQDVAFSPGLYDAAYDALQADAPVFCDAQMVASGITRKRLPKDNDVICTLSQVGPAGENTRSAMAVDLWQDRLEGAVVAIGNAPTALFHLLDLVAAGGPRPAAVLGIPVGFIGAAESKEALIASDLEHLVVRGRRGGSAIVAAAVNALATVVE